MTKMNSQQLRQWALSMYLHQSLTQTEIAERCGVSRMTIVRWSKLDHWDEHKASLTMTREEQIKSMQRQIVEINNNILSREQGKRFATTAEADTIAKLTNAINKLETEAGIHEIVGVGRRFIEWIRPIDPSLVKIFTELFDKFIKASIK